MTLEEFMQEFETHAKPGEWGIDAFDNLRNTVTEECPVCFVATKLGLNPIKQTEQPAFTKLAQAMKMNERTAVMDAADNVLNRGKEFTPQTVKELRARMFKACGIETTPA